MQEHDALERELKELVLFEEQGVDPTGKWSKMDKKAIKARVRMIKNRLAAKRSREHARNYVQELEGTLEALQSKNEDLARRLAALEAENEKLKRNGGLPVVASRWDAKVDEAETKDRTSEPAALATSLQLDAVLLLLSAIASTILPSPSPAAPCPSSPCRHRAAPSARPGGLPRRCATAAMPTLLRRAGLPPGRLRPHRPAMPTSA